MMRAVRHFVPVFLLIMGCGNTPQPTIAADRALGDRARDLVGPCTGEICGPGKVCVGRECVDELAVWPNRESRACSDPWLALHHRELRQLRPRVLALNFVNAKSNAQMLTHLGTIVAALAEASRARGYANADAPSQLKLEIAYAIDLRDHPPPRDWPWNNSTHYPREDPRQGTWGFDYGALFTAAFAQKLGIVDPADPAKTPLDLCQLVERGLVHEVWVYGDGDKPDDAGAAEILEQKPFYTIARARDTGKPLSRCAGNGCFDADDPIPSGCKRTVRIGWVNHARGPGCFLESLAHGFESTANHTPPLIPYLAAHFPGFAGFDLHTRYKLPFSSWYFCAMSSDCLSYPTPSSVSYQVAGHSGTVQDYDPVCGNVHFPPNARRHYDLVNPQPVLSSCESYASGVGGKQEFTIARFAPYQTLGQDCMGAFLIYFWQNVPGHDAKAIGRDGKPMLSWWPFLYY